MIDYLTPDDISRLWGEEIDTIWDFLRTHSDEDIVIFFDIVDPSKWLRGVEVFSGSLPTIFKIVDSIDGIRIDRSEVNPYPRLDTDIQFFIMSEARSEGSFTIEGDKFLDVKYCLLDTIQNLKVGFADSIEFISKSYYKTFSESKSNRSRYISNSHKIDFDNLDIINVCDNIYEFGLNFRIKK